MKIVYSFDDNYAVPGGVSIKSLLEHHRDAVDLSICIIDGHISEINKKRIDDMVSEYGHSVEYLALETLIQDLKCTTGFNVSSYARLFLAEMLLSDDRIIYIDSDTIINGSLQELQSWPLTNTLVAGVSDTVNPYYRRLIGFNRNEPYICAGVVVLNLNLWRKWSITRKCVEFIEMFAGNPPHNDQGTINWVCRGHISILPAKYNVMNPMLAFSCNEIKRLFLLKEYYSQEEINDAIQTPFIIHYTDEFYNRPWFGNCSHPLKQVWRNVFSATPWITKNLPVRKPTKNCKIQNAVYRFCPFSVYLLMVRFIAWRHLWKASK